MKADEYLSRLQAQLRGVPSEKQVEVIEEITAHMEEGQSDVRLGDNPASRGERLMNEMGAPEEMGDRMRDIHHHNRWFEYFLVVLPALIIIPLVNLLLSWFLPHSSAGQAFNEIFMYWTIRASFLVHVFLIVISIQLYRRLNIPGPAVYWLAGTFWSVGAICLREQRWNLNNAANQAAVGMLETFFWSAALVGLGIGLFRIITRARDPLITVLGLLPFCFALANLVTGQMLNLGYLPNGYQLPQWTLGILTPAQITMVIWPALFFLFRQRPVRWLGLLALAVPSVVMNLVASAPYPGLILLWLVALLLVPAGWVVDRHILHSGKMMAR